MARLTAATDVCRTVMQRLSAASMQTPRVRGVLSMCAAVSTDSVAQQRISVESNCVLNPQPPLGGAPVGIRQNKMIGYYESWSARKACHKVAPTDLPLDALTHVNFAFAYIEPTTYQVVTMDESTPATLFQDTTNVKSIKQDIKVFVSIGGWTFSDNDTSTQPLFGEIAADATKRQTFANNVVHFMKQYGFDGVDIDWEYPGAPDRRGNPEDTDNYVLLLKTMREAFDASGSTYGLTFTAPSSYWYLRWFDLPNMIKYADWINLMSYDLHGAWDATNPIGSIVQAHTNLTEIKLAADLFWRVNIPPSKVVMGFGFYGRSFTLSDPSCTDPGCPFSGASQPGPCSDTGGILAYYEIMAALDGSTSSSKRATISPTHDKTAAVNYFTFDKDQWVSYDDATTFKQKVDWADSVGLGGGMIWASDLDTDKYTAHGALTGKTIQSNPSLQAVNKALSNPVAVVEDLAGSNGQNCFVYKGKCVNLNDNKAMSDACGPGNTVVGWDDDGCGKKSCHCGKPVCCPTNSAPKSCIWRGDDNGGGAGSDCSAQCRPGELNIKGIRSSWGGGFLNDGDTDKCGRGWKVFCCPDPDYATVTKGCSYAKCRASCPTGTSEAFKKYDDCWFGGQSYCCPDPVELTGCHWEGGTGGADCANANCNATEVEVDRATYGDQSTACDWNRQKAMCCTIKTAPPKPATCSADLCKTFPGYCSTDDNDEGANDWAKRDLALFKASDKSLLFEKRGNAETYYPKHIRGVRVIAWAYPALRALYNEYPALYQILRRWFRLIPGYCVGPSINSGPFARENQVPSSDLADLEAEHPIDRQLAVYFLDSTVTGVLPSGDQSSLPTIDPELLRQVWLADNEALGNEARIGGPNGIQPNTPNDRFMEAFGSDTYPYPFIGVGRDINGAKGRIMKGSVPCALTRIDTMATTAVESDSQDDVDTLLQSIRVAFAVFDYLNDPEVSIRFNAVRQQIYLQATYIERDAGIPNFAAWWDQWLTNYLATTQERIRSWARDAIDRAAAPFVQAHNEEVDLFTYAQVIGALEAMLEEVDNIRFPPDTSMRNPQP
ncbi:hypothetical protein AbraCBS73388_007488 [Aspergillus brasiliensis]|uniref:chitinase n=1 Tax=Aspergillus brasiliensis TaxID=319629 RepID=A0A9W5YR75_9EURO|nr:hypothetical protein AbraCBS73388_007488 [Aspergillus brasiliensis]